MEPNFLVLGTLIVCGVIGGTYNYFLDKDNVHHLLAWLLGGVIASASIPLFLSVIGSDDLRKILEGSPILTKPEVSVSYLKFMGFCLLAAVFSRRFLQTLSDRIFEQLREQGKRIEETSKEVRQTKRELVTISDSVVEGNIVEADIDPGVDHQLSEDDVRVLKCFSEGTIPLRSVEGLALSVGVPSEKITEILNSLKARKLVEEVSTWKGKRWRLREAGRALASQHVVQGKAPDANDRTRHEHAF